MRGIRIDVGGGQAEGKARVGNGLEGPTTTGNEQMNGEGKGEHEAIEHNPGIKKIVHGWNRTKKKG